MSVFSPRTAAATTVAAPPRCESCHATGVPLVTITIPGAQVPACADPAACRQRAQAAGMWRVYESTGVRR
jgi:hypothetical protein